MYKKLNIFLIFALIAVTIVCFIKIKAVNKLKRKIKADSTIVNELKHKIEADSTIVNELKRKIKADSTIVNTVVPNPLAQAFYKYLNQYVDEENAISSSSVGKHDEVSIVTFAGGNAKHYLDRILLTASSHRFGIDKVLWYSPKDIDSKFYATNEKILNQKRGYGYWLWKPYVILEAMKRSPENSIIFYVDSDLLLTKDPEQLIEYAKKYNRVLLEIPFKNQNYIKRDTFILMNQDNEEAYLDNQKVAGFMLLVNNKENRQFISEWLDLCQDERLLTDIPSTFGAENKEFIDHRHDQAILSLLALKYKNQIILPQAECEQYFEYQDVEKYFSRLISL